MLAIATFHFFVSTFVKSSYIKIVFPSYSRSLFKVISQLNIAAFQILQRLAFISKETTKRMYLNIFYFGGGSVLLIR